MVVENCLDKLHCALASPNAQTSKPLMIGQAYLFITECKYRIAHLQISNIFLLSEI
jgi:hypothetical protein